MFLPDISFFFKKMSIIIHLAGNQYGQTIFYCPQFMMYFLRQQAHILKVIIFKFLDKKLQNNKAAEPLFSNLKNNQLS